MADLVTIAEFARMKGVNQSSVRKQVDGGVIKTDGKRPARFDPDEADRAIAQHMQPGQIVRGAAKIHTSPAREAWGKPREINVPRGTESTVDGDHLEKPDAEPGPLSADTNLFEARRIREIAAAGREKLAEEREGLHLLKIKGELMAVEDHLRVISDMILETKARVMAVAARVAPQLQGQTSRVMIQAVVEKALRDALTDLAERVPKFTKPEPSEDDFSAFDKAPRKNAGPKPKGEK